MTPQPRLLSVCSLHMSHSASQTHTIHAKRLSFFMYAYNLCTIYVYINCVHVVLSNVRIYTNMYINILLKCEMGGGEELRKTLLLRLCLWAQSMNLELLHNNRQSVEQISRQTYTYNMQTHLPLTTPRQRSFLTNAPTRTPILTPQHHRHL